MKPLSITRSSDGWFAPAISSGSSAAGGRSDWPEFAVALTMASAAPATDRQEAAIGLLTPLVLTQLFETMLPRSQVQKGNGLAADVWRSMLAQQLAVKLADRVGSLVAVNPAQSILPPSVGGRR